MKKVIIGIGIPGAGKTTVLKDFAHKNGYYYLSLDNIRVELAGTAIDQSKNKEAWNLARERIKEYFDQGLTIVVDATFTKCNQRIDFLNFLRQECDAEKIQGVWVDTPIEIARERNAERDRVVPEYAMDRMHSEIENDIPQLSNGFDSIFRLDKDQNLVEAVIENPASENHVHRNFPMK